MLHQTITCELKYSEKDFSRQFYPQTFTHDWQVNSICYKSSSYDQAKEYNDFQFYYFSFKPETTTTTKKKKKKIYAILNHFRIVVQPRLELTILYIHTTDASVYFKTEYLTPDINVLGCMMSSLVSTTMPPATPPPPARPKMPLYML